MAKLSARFVIISAILAGTEVASIIEQVKEKCGSTKEDAAIKKDINWYRAYAKKEGLVEDDGFATEAGEEWVKNGGKKPVDPEVLAKREAKKVAAAKKAEEKKAPKTKVTPESTKASTAAKAMNNAKNASDKAATTGTKKPTTSNKPAAANAKQNKPAAASAKAQTSQDDDL